MKAILLINETPKKCHDCQLMTDDMYCKGFTPCVTKDGIRITKRCVEDYVMHGDKPSNCPLLEINDNIAKLIEVAR